MNRLKYEFEKMNPKPSMQQVVQDHALNYMLCCFLMSGTALKTLQTLCEVIGLPGDPLQYLREGRLVFDSEKTE
jgi:hypothetical protein